MKDSWGPLKALAVASIINGFGDIFLCCFCGYGIAGAAWATMVSQVLYLEYLYLFFFEGQRQIVANNILNKKRFKYLQKTRLLVPQSSTIHRN